MKWISILVFASAFSGLIFMSNVFLNALFGYETLYREPNKMIAFIELALGLFSAVMMLVFTKEETKK